MKACPVLGRDADSLNAYSDCHASCNSRLPGSLRGPFNVHLQGCLRLSGAQPAVSHPWKSYAYPLTSPKSQPAEHRVLFLLQTLPALPAGSSKKRDNDGASEQDGQLQLGSLVVVCKQGVVQGYSKTQVKVVFTPAVPGPVREQISIAFRCVRCSKMQTGMAQHCIDAAAVQQLSNGCIAMQITTAALLHQSTPHTRHAS